MAEPTRLTIDTPTGEQTVLVTSEERILRLTEILRRNALPLNIRCGERGLCNGCHVELLRGALVHRGSGEPVAADGEAVQLRACEYCVAEGQAVEIRVPARSLLVYEPQAVSDFRVNVPRAHHPLWQQAALPRPKEATGEDAARAVCAVAARAFQTEDSVDLAPSVELPRDGAAVTEWWATLEYQGARWHITRLAQEAEPGGLGLAVDIGTTTVALMLVDLATGEILERAAGFNHQLHLGDDVLTRINLCSTDPAMLKRLQWAVVNRTIAPLAWQVLQQTGAAVERLSTLVVAGNTTMLHLLVGEDPTPLGVVPFTPRFLEHRVVQADGLGLELDSGASPSVHLLDGASAYIGADICAGVLSSGLLYDEGPSLLVDVGTNGEIVLKHGDRLLGCATAAGPAFEGSGLACGIRAGEGAIAHVRFSRQPAAVHTELIAEDGRRKPAGLCGSAYVDLLAEGRRVGLLSSTGRFDRQAVPGTDDWFVPFGEYGTSLRVAHGQGGRDIVLSEPDIARLLQAKAAIAAGQLILLERAGLRSGDVKTLYLAGGFGMHIDVAGAIACGLLPGFTVEQVQVVGNTSLAGAYLAMLDSGAAAEVARIGRRMEIVELNLDPGFETCFIDQLSLP